MTKRLTCIHSLGVCHVSGQFENREINLIVGTYQAAVLSLFNDYDELNYSEIRKLLRLDDDYLVKVLHSLACDKYEILKKRPSSGMISRDDSFVFNHEFTDESSSIEIPLPVKVHEDMIFKGDRDRATGASIVRILKKHNVKDFRELVLECVEYISRHFKPEWNIKQQLEVMIGKEYIERDAILPNVFHYVP